MFKSRPSRAIASTLAVHICYCSENPNEASKPAVAAAAIDATFSICSLIFANPSNDIYYDQDSHQVRVLLPSSPMSLQVAKRSFMNLFQYIVHQRQQRD